MRPTPHVAWIGLGSNLDAPADQLDRALAALADAPEITLLACSSFYRTAPVGGPTDQPVFCNAAAAVATSSSPWRLLDRLFDIEADQGRVRDRRWGPRTLDLDMLAFDERIQDHPRLTLPHPRAHERPFVLVPLAEIAPVLTLGRHGRVVDCLARYDASDIQRWSGRG